MIALPSKTDAPVEAKADLERVPGLASAGSWRFALASVQAEARPIARAPCGRAGAGPVVLISTVIYNAWRFHDSSRRSPIFLGQRCMSSQKQNPDKRLKPPTER